jgi:RNA recognition motif-containing protein
MNIYVGNLPRVTTEAELRQAFEAYGRVATASVIKDKFSGESRGFGFVEMPEKTEAMAAIAAMNGKDFGGRTLTVNEARPREERPRDGGGARKWDDRRGGHRDRNRPGGKQAPFLVVKA